MHSKTHNSPAVQRWLDRFAEEPVIAVDKLLCGRVNMGPYQRAEPAEILWQILTDDSQYQRLDQALQDWLQNYLDTTKTQRLQALGNQNVADALLQAFYAIARLELPQAWQWCAAHQGSLRRLCRAYYFGTSLDPEAELLTTLVGQQPNRKLQPLWLSLARFSGATQAHHAPIGLIGLRLMPADDNGTVEHGVPKSLLRGVLDYGEGLARRGDQKQGGKLWLRQLDMLAAMYPQSPQTWSRRFREAILTSRSPSRAVRNWLDQRYPGALQANGNHHSKSATPMPEETKALVRRLRELPLERVRLELQAFLDKHRNYAWDTGDSYYLTRAFGVIGNALLKKDPSWARQLAHEAACWEPNNHYIWSLLARALEAEGDWERAQAVLWHARRRFPHDVHRHSQLGSALAMHGELEQGEAVYREAIRLFPDNPVCRTDLANTLRLSGQGEQAVAVYKDTRDVFPKNAVVAGGLADTLIDVEHLEEAQEALEWAESIAETKDEDRVNASIRRRLQGALSGKPVHPKTPPPPTDNIPTGTLADLADITGVAFDDAEYLGQATLWRQRREPRRAEKALQNLPDSSDKLIETALLRGQDDWKAAAAFFDERGTAYEGDGVVRFHHLRARSRCGEAVDWGQEKQRYPELNPLFVTEERGEPPHFQWDENDPELSDSQRLNLWLSQTLLREDGDNLRDVVEEEWAAAYHQW